MHQLIVIISLLCLSFSLNAQTLKGKVYDATGTVKNIKVYNETQKRLTVTSKEGDFSLIAKVNDTLLFESIFYHPKVVILNNSHFKDIAVFELKKIVSELDEVEIIAEPEQPIFEEQTYNIELQNLIQEDIKNNPGLYQPAGATYGVDFIAIIGLVAKLFKKKNKYKVPAYSPITYKQMDSLFKKSTFFNKRLVTENLKIPEDKAHLFYDFCEAKYISSELLKDEKKMQLLEQLVLNSQLFLILLEQYGEKNVIKD
ncbi:hypothetical protein [Winogradskyella sp.]|uniref:hypothetical protein n=1 Tax=Winogradskyella sp. TaxID=1883156 RepID=UPI0025FAD16D|nr:hypothetical protein [Winogradskyella sp.]